MHRLLLVLLGISASCLLTEGYLFESHPWTTSRKVADLPDGIAELHLPPMWKAFAALLRGDQEAFHRYVLEMMNNTLPISEDNTDGSERGQARRDGTDDDLTELTQALIDFFTDPRKFWLRVFGIPINETILEVPEGTTISGQARRDGTDDDLPELTQVFIDFFTDPLKFWLRVFGIPINGTNLEVPEGTTINAGQAERDAETDDVQTELQEQLKQLLIDFFTNPKKFWRSFFGLPVIEDSQELPKIWF